MPATSLLFVIKDAVFDCSNQLPQAGMRKYAFNDGAALPAIGDTLNPAGTTLILASHGGPGGIQHNGATITATAYAQRVLQAIQQANRITKIIYFACFPAATVVQIPNVHQLAPSGTLTLVAGGNLRVDNNHAVSPSSILGVTTTGNGWTWF